MLLALKSSNRPNAGLSGACQRLISRLPVPLDYAESRMPCPDLTFCEGWREAHIQMGFEADKATMQSLFDHAGHPLKVSPDPS